MGERLVTLRETEHRSGHKKSWIYAAMADGRFPACIKVGRSSFWAESAIDKWIAHQINASQKAA